MWQRAVLQGDLRCARFGWGSPTWSNSTRSGRWIIYWPCLESDGALHPKLPQVTAPAGAVLKSYCTYLWRKLEHGGTHDEWSGVVFSCQCQSVSPTHSNQGAIGQDCLCTNYDLKRANQNWIACSTANWRRNTSWLKPWQMSWRKTVSVQPASSWSYRAAECLICFIWHWLCTEMFLTIKSMTPTQGGQHREFQKTNVCSTAGNTKQKLGCGPCCSTNLQSKLCTSNLTTNCKNALALWLRE